MNECYLDEQPDAKSILGQEDWKPSSFVRFKIVQVCNLGHIGDEVERVSVSDTQCLGICKQCGADTRLAVVKFLFVPTRKLHVCLYPGIPKSERVTKTNSFVPSGCYAEDPKIVRFLSDRSDFSEIKQ